MIDDYTAEIQRRTACLRGLSRGNSAKKFARCMVADFENEAARPLYDFQVVADGTARLLDQ